jgi:phospholipid transport system substrate-binding protein
MTMSTKLYSFFCRGVVLALFFSAIAGPAFAQKTADAIRTMLEQRDRDIKTLVGTDDKLSADVKEKLRDEINDVIDFRAMGREALGRQWDRLSEEQQEDFVDKFSQVVRAQSLANLDVYRAKVTYDEITVGDSTAHVVTTTTYKDTPTKVEYDLRYNGTDWVATDIILNEVSTVGGYSRSFQSLIRKKGFDELMTKLNERIEEAESNVS